MTDTARAILTSFSVWRADQTSNSSDDLLGLWAERAAPGNSVKLLRQLPVNTLQASDRIIAEIEREQPDYVLCGGMAESRAFLELETRARCAESVRYSPANLGAWCRGLRRTRLSHDAGTFVCNGTYYHVLQWIQDRGWPVQCVFIHVPVLTASNQLDILSDFSAIVQNCLVNRALLTAALRVVDGERGQPNIRTQ
ncbi:MAG: peptidase C15 [Cyanobacteria bacterium P01_F01_bin.33]